MTSTTTGTPPTPTSTPSVTESLAECRRLTDDLHDMVADFMDHQGLADPVTGERRPLIKAEVVFPGHIVRRPAGPRWRRVGSRILHPDGTITFAFDDLGGGDRVSRLARYEKGTDADLDCQQALSLNPFTGERDGAGIDDYFDQAPLTAEEGRS